MQMSSQMAGVPSKILFYGQSIWTTHAYMFAHCCSNELYLRIIEDGMGEEYDVPSERYMLRCRQLSFI